MTDLSLYEGMMRRGANARAGRVSSGHLREPLWPAEPRTPACIECGLVIPYSAGAYCAMCRRRVMPSAPASSIEDVADRLAAVMAARVQLARRRRGHLTGDADTDSSEDEGYVPGLITAEMIGLPPGPHCVRCGSTRHNGSCRPWCRSCRKTLPAGGRGKFCSGACKQSMGKSGSWDSCWTCGGSLPRSSRASRKTCSTGCKRALTRSGATAKAVSPFRDA
jgi:hypothetical protein